MVLLAFGLTAATHMVKPRMRWVGWAFGVGPRVLPGRGEAAAWPTDAPSLRPGTVQHQDGCLLSLAGPEARRASPDPPHRPPIARVVPPRPGGRTAPESRHSSPWLRALSVNELADRSPEIATTESAIDRKRGAS